jgi:hypothetical protein
MSRKTHGSGEPDWLKMVGSAVITIAVIAGGTGHLAGGPAPQPTTGCVQLQAANHVS